MTSLLLNFDYEVTTQLITAINHKRCYNVILEEMVEEVDEWREEMKLGDEDDEAFDDIDIRGRTLCQNYERCHDRNLMWDLDINPDHADDEHMYFINEKRLNINLYKSGFNHFR